MLVVDDHAVVREGLRAFLELQDGIEVAGEAADGEEAIEVAERLSPDVVLMDLVMPRLDGVGAMRALRERVPAARVIVLTSFLDEDRLLPGAARGRGRLPAQERRSRRSWPARCAPRTPARRCSTRWWRRGSSRRWRGEEEPLDRLTPREREVLELIGRGYANKRIALALELSEKTVKTHVGHVLAKLGVTDRTQAAVVAVRAGLVGPGSALVLGPIAPGG